MNQQSSSSSSLTGNVLLVNDVQRGNPLLTYIRNIKWSFTKDIVPDYAISAACVLFVTVRYHHRHPKHIMRRIEEVGRNYRLRILLVFVDDENNLTALQELNRIAFLQNFTLILASSNIECARYLETLKSYENKSSITIQQKEETDFLPRITRALTSVRSVNKTDVITLLDVFGNFSEIAKASEADLVLCPGIGAKKVKRLYQALHCPFEEKSKSTRPKLENKEDMSDRKEVLEVETKTEGVASTYDDLELQSSCTNNLSPILPLTTPPVNALQQQKQTASL